MGKKAINNMRSIKVKVIQKKKETVYPREFFNIGDGNSYYNLWKSLY